MGNRSCRGVAALRPAERGAGPGASAELVARWRDLSDAFEGIGSRAVGADVVLHGSGYGAILAARAREFGGDFINIMLFVLPELVAFMALGMAMLKGGFLSGQWTGEQYRATWRRAYLVGLVPTGWPRRLGVDRA